MNAPVLFNSTIIWRSPAEKPPPRGLSGIDVLIVIAGFPKPICAFYDFEDGFFYSEFGAEYSADKIKAWAEWPATPPICGEAVPSQVLQIKNGRAPEWFSEKARKDFPDATDDQIEVLFQFASEVAKDAARKCREEMAIPS